MQQIGCQRCRHYRVTHDPLRPAGCTAYGFKCRILPAREVERVSGLPCQMYSARKESAGVLRNEEKISFSIRKST